MSQIIGHSRQRDALTRLFKSKKVPSTLLFCGPSGIGKSLVASELFRTLMCEKAEKDNNHFGGCSDCHGCKLFDSGNHPDSFRVECLDKETWNVEAIRELLYSLHLSAFQGKNRVILFNDADFLSVQSANTLLKAFEEPRPNTYFCLLASNPSRLPRTVVSRCQAWFFDSLSDKELQEILKLQSDLPEKIRAEAVALADGSAGNFDQIQNQVELWSKISSTMDRIAEGDAALGATFAAELAKEKDALRSKISLMRIHARRRMYEDTANQPHWARCMSDLIACERLVLERHLSAHYLLSHLFYTLATTHERHSFAARAGRDSVIEDFAV